MTESFWTLLYVPTATEKTLAAWGIDQSSVSVEFLSQDTDRMTFRMSGTALDAAAPFDFGSTCILKRNGVRFFYGRVTKTPRRGNGGEESLEYELSGPWWYFDNRPVEQEWNMADDPNDPNSSVSPQRRSRLLLGHKIDGTFQTSGQQIVEAVQYAQSFGAPIAVGTIDGGHLITVSEHTSLSVAEVIREMMRWAPDAVGYFDHTTTPYPTFNVLRRASLTALELSVFAGAGDEQINLTPRPDLQVPGVIVYYEQENSINEKSWSTVTRDAAGADTFGTLVFTIQLGGSSLTYQRQEVTIQSVDLTARAFWESLFPPLHQATDVTISDVRLNNVLVAGQAADATDGSSGYTGVGMEDFSGVALPPPTSPPSTVNALTNGQVPYWLTSHFSDAAASAKISYTLINHDTGSLKVVEKEVFTAKFKLTDLNPSPFPQGFEQQTSFTAAEPIPTGLASYMLSTLSTLHYDGEFVMVEDEVGTTIRLGKKLNFVGGPSEWETANAMIQAVQLDLGTGRTSVKVGPPGHLSIQDLVELLRIQRTRHASQRIQERVTGIRYGGAQVGGAFQVTQNNSAPAGVPGKEQKIASKDADTGQVGHVHSKTSPLEATHTVRSQVLDEDGEPVAGQPAAQVEGKTEQTKSSHTVEFTNAAGQVLRVVIDTSDFPDELIATLADELIVKLRAVRVCNDEHPTENNWWMAVLCSEPFQI